MDNVPEKKCNGPCGRTLPMTTEHFHRNSHTKDGLKTQCKLCISNGGKEYRARPEIRASRRAYKTSPQYLAREREHYQEKKSHILTYKKEYRARPEVRAHKQVYWQDYYHQRGGRDKALTNKYRRNAHKKAVSGIYTPKQIQEQLKRQKYRCYYATCGFAKFEKRKDGSYIYHVEHTFPLSRVIGTDIPANDISYLVLACPSCNLKKFNKFPWEFPEGGRLL